MDRPRHTHAAKVDQLKWTARALDPRPAVTTAGQVRNRPAKSRQTKWALSATAPYRVARPRYQLILATFASNNNTGYEASWQREPGWPPK